MVPWTETIGDRKLHSPIKNRGPKVITLTEIIKDAKSLTENIRDENFMTLL
jgi:hypothetical protein